MTLRHKVHRTISSGSTVYATVESYALGKATVRIHGGSRLTNLSTIGGDVAEGDTVIVDYSAGTVPIVRPIFPEAEEEIELDPLEVNLPDIASLAQEPAQEDFPIAISDLRPDIGCLAHHQHGYFNESVTWWYFMLNSNTPTLLPWSFNEGVEYDDGDYWARWYGAEWASTGLMDLTSLMGSAYITIPVTGKYIIIVYWNDYMSGETNNLNAYYRARIIKNDTDVLGVATKGSMYGDNGQPGINMTKIAYLTQGDTLALELFHNYDYDYEVDGIGYVDNVSRAMAVQLIPFTMEEQVS